MKLQLTKRCVRIFVTCTARSKQVAGLVTQFVNKKRECKLALAMLSLASTVLINTSDSQISTNDTK